MPEKATTTALRNTRRITFQIVKSNNIQREFELSLMPESYILDEPGRVTVSQTRGGAFIDNFGLGIGSLVIGGTTGYREGENRNLSARKDFTVDGYERWVDFREFFRFFFKTQTDSPSEQVVMAVLDWTQENYLNCVPTGIPRLQRNVAQPLLYRYELSLSILGRINLTGFLPKKDDVLGKIQQRTTRAGAIAGRIDEEVRAQWEEFISLAHGGNIPELTQEQQDENLQTFVAQILANNTPPGYSPPTDSQLGLVPRTRSLSEKIADYAQGETQFIATTLNEARVVMTEWRAVLDALDFAASIPAGYAREVRELLCACQSILTYPQIFRQTVEGTFTELTALLEDSGCATTLRI